MEYPSQAIEENEPNFMTHNGNHLFHYTSFESALKIISSRTLLFGNFRRMNDILELGLITFDYSREGKKDLDKYKAISLIWDERCKRGFEIDPLWGYYANKCRGVCLVFDKTKLLKAFKSMQCFRRFGKIHYIKNSSDMIFPENSEKLGPKEIQKGYKKIFFTKSRDWHVEHEYRLLIKDVDGQCKELQFGDALMAVVLCMPLCKYIKKTAKYNRLRNITNVPILRYHTGLGNKMLTELCKDKKEDEQLWPLCGIDYEIDTTYNFVEKRAD